MSKSAAAFFSGVVFALGLGIGGMTQPQKIIAFLDVFGAWDPSLAFVMGGALAVQIPLLRYARRRSRPSPATAGVSLNSGAIDGKLVAGAGIFGVGWGLGGFCPGPAVTSLANGLPQVLIFVGAMVGGMMLYKFGAPLLRDRRKPLPETGGQLADG